MFNDVIMPLKCLCRNSVFFIPGIGTSSVYCDPSTKLDIFPYECQKKGSIIIKSHRPNIEGFDKVILLIRSPRDAFMAYFNFDKGGFKANVSSRTLVKCMYLSLYRNLYIDIDIYNEFELPFLLNSNCNSCQTCH